MNNWCYVKFQEHTILNPCKRYFTGKIAIEPITDLTHLSATIGFFRELLCLIRFKYCVKKRNSLKNSLGKKFQKIKALYNYSLVIEVQRSKHEFFSRRILIRKLEFQHSDRTCHKMYLIGLRIYQTSSKFTLAEKWRIKRNFSQLINSLIKIYFTQWLLNNF